MYVKWLLLIAMMKLHLAALRLRSSLRAWLSYSEERIKTQKDLIVERKNGMQKKVKEIKSLFKTIVSGSRSGSGKLIFRHYDKLSLYGVVLLISSLYRLELLLERWMTNINSFFTDLDVQTDSNTGHVNDDQDESDREPDLFILFYLFFL